MDAGDLSIVYHIGLVLVALWAASVVFILAFLYLYMASTPTSAVAPTSSWPSRGRAGRRREAPSAMAGTSSWAEWSRAGRQRDPRTIEANGMIQGGQRDGWPPAGHAAMLGRDESQARRRGLDYSVSTLGRMNRRFLNLIVQDMNRPMYSLHCLDPLKYLFYPTAEARKVAQAKLKNNKPGGLSMIERLSVLPKPQSNFHPTPRVIQNMGMDSFSLLGSDSIVFTDSSRRTALYNTDLGTFTVIPPMNSCKSSFGFSLPMIKTNPVGETEDRSLYVIHLSCDAEINSCFETLSYNDGWCWHTLPGPPFLSVNPSFRRSITKCCYTVVDSSTICISSMEQDIGTYTFDTVSHVWRQVGKWVLPLYGKAEYVPELKLWLGLSDCKPSPRLCAFNLSAMDAQQPPMPQHTWDYLDLTEDNKTLISELHLINLGSGMFCIATLLRTMFIPDSPWIYDEDMMDIIEEEFLVLTGVKVEKCCDDSEAPLQMIKHKSKRYDLRCHSMKSPL